jgi:recombinational DNA repair protein (RecF pathway)
LERVVELKTEGIVLKKFKQGEADDITIIFTRDMGKVLVNSKSTRRLSSKLKPSLELFSLNKYFLVKPKKESKYFRLVQAENIKMFESMRMSLRKIGFSYLVMELLHKFTELEDPNQELYDSAMEIMNIVESGDYSNVENIESYFKLKILKVSGYDLTGDATYLHERHVTREMRTLLNSISGARDVKKLDVEYDIIREINMLIDAYIIYILGEDIFSTKFLHGLKDEKK